jgi:hypothetical protein
MSIQHPQALAGFLLAKARTYPLALGLPGWLIDVLKEQQSRSLPPTLVTATAMLRPEYIRDYSAKWMTLPSQDELQGYIDPPSLVVAVGGWLLDPEHFLLAAQPEFQALPADQQERAVQFVQAQLAWAQGLVQPQFLQDGTVFMGKVFQRLRTGPANEDYRKGALIAHDTFCMHNDFVRSFALHGPSSQTI